MAPARNVRPFVHLRVFSSYSLGHGLSTPGDVCRHARRVGFDTVALTDVGGTYGFVEFHRAAREVGVKPIYGALLVLDWGEAPSAADPLQTLILLALDRAGLRNVCAAATLSATRRERRESLTVADVERFTDGVVAIAAFSPVAHGPSPHHYFAALRSHFADRLFVEYRHGIGEQHRLVQTDTLVEASALGIPSVLVQDVRVVGPARLPLPRVALATERAFEHRVFCDARFDVTRETNAMQTAAEMSSAYDDAPDAHSNAALIAALVQPDLMSGAGRRTEPGRPGLFDPDTEASRVLRERALGALAQRVGSQAAMKLRLEVLEDEFIAIDRAGVAGTMLQFAEVVSTLRIAGVTIGPATGLSMQSLCAYLLGLTAFDPFAHDAAFRARFDAQSANVLDIQTAPEFRTRVLGTLNRVFDGSGIGYVPSVEHITATRALRIVARDLDATTPEVEDAIKVASRHHGATLREMSEDQRAFGSLYRRSAAFREVVASAAAIEGLPFGFARTKRSVIVSSNPLRASFSFTVDPETGDRFVQSTRDSFPFGDIRRIDIATLHVLAATDSEWTNDDPGVYAAISGGELDGVYLLEGAPGRIAREMGVSTFADLVHFVALLRQRRTGASLAQRIEAFRGADRAIPAASFVGDVLAPTQGTLLFNDQARDVVGRLTKLGCDDASEFVDRFRDHAPGNLATLRRDFLALTVETGVSFEDATAWFSRLLRNVHSALDRQRVIAEALVVRACVIAKTRDRAAFFAHLLDGALDAAKRARYVSILESEQRWLPPSVFESAYRHAVVDGCVRAPLWTIDGITQRASDAVIRMRANARNMSRDEFRLAASAAGITLEAIDALFRAGAFDDVAGTGKGAGSTDPVFVSATTSEHVDRASSGAVPDGLLPLDSVPARTSSIDAEKDGNSRHGFRVVPSLSEFYPHPSATPVELAGRIRNFRDFKTSSGTSVGFFELFDSSGSVRVFVPWERVARIGEPLSDGYHVTVKGKVRLRDGRKVCDALEIVVAEGGNGHGETSPDDSSKGDS